MWKKYEDEKDKKEKEEKKKTPEELIASYSKEKLLKKYRNPYNLSREEREKMANLRAKKAMEEQEKKVQAWYETLEKSYQENKFRGIAQRRKRIIEKQKIEDIKNRVWE